MTRLGPDGAFGDVMDFGYRVDSAKGSEVTAGSPWPLGIDGKAIDTPKGHRIDPRNRGEGKRTVFDLILASPGQGQ